MDSSLKKGNYYLYGKYITTNNSASNTNTPPKKYNILDTFQKYVSLCPNCGGKKNIPLPITPPPSIPQ